MLREQKEFEEGLRDRPPEEPIKQRLERIVIPATSDRPDLQIFIGRLQHQGVDVYPTLIGDERKGFAFEYEGFRCRGSSLKNCSWKKLYVQLTWLATHSRGKLLGNSRRNSA